MSLVRHIRHSYKPQTDVLVPNAAGVWRATPAAAGQETVPGLIIYRFCADLFYANIDRFADQIPELIDSAPTPIRCLVLDAGTVSDIDNSAARGLRDLLAGLA